MQVDWLTVTAQIANFLVLIWLLRWALYRPLARALRAREVAVAQRLEAAEAARAEAEAAAETHRAATRALEQEREDRLERAEQEAEATKAALLDAAKQEISARRAAWQEQLADEKAAFLDRLRRRAAASFVATLRHILDEMADQELVEGMARTFARRLAALEPAQQARLRAAADDGDRPTILASLPLSERARELVGEAVVGLLDRPAEPGFEADPGLGCGLVLRLGSQHVGWTIAEHLDGFEKEVAQMLEAGEAEP
ncbi:F0F1 ATP synthase subunit B family protein [Acidimangrovimonas pyrenivorans]|uniref:ATP synthase subunit b n=1 Tax=Acidimangrovimonas pyrenivorans TaxID=2030798 RepID=A0ABV7AGC1_9RHOB